MDSSDLSDGPITLQEYLEVKKALASSEAKVQQLMKVNNNLSEELRRLQKEVWAYNELTCMIKDRLLNNCSPF